MFKRAVMGEENVRPVGNISPSNVYWVTGMCQALWHLYVTYTISFDGHHNPVKQG